jgi:hypothetical protein
MQCKHTLNLNWGMNRAALHLILLSQAEIQTRRCRHLASWNQQHILDCPGSPVNGHTYGLIMRRRAPVVVAVAAFCLHTVGGAGQLPSSLQRVRLRELQRGDVGCKRVLPVRMLLLLRCHLQSCLWVVQQLWQTASLATLPLPASVDSAQQLDGAAAFIMQGPVAPRQSCNNLLPCCRCCVHACCHCQLPWHPSASCITALSLLLLRLLALFVTTAPGLLLPTTQQQPISSNTYPFITPISFSCARKRHTAAEAVVCLACICSARAQIVSGTQLF